MPCVLSVDLAYVHYRDVGVALLHDAPRHVEFLDVPLSGAPDPHVLADWLMARLHEHQAAGLCIDGPHAWKAPDTDSPHCRRSERQLRAPGKTGLPPDGVKPATYLAFTRFSLTLFERLTGHYGLVLPGQRDAAVTSPFAAECFPTAAWRALGQPPLAAKRKATPDDVRAAAVRFTQVTGFTLSRAPTHDELQAAVGGVAALSWAVGQHGDVHLAGDPPFRLDGSWREGYIMVPASRAS
jgi:hypothetical protein